MNPVLEKLFAHFDDYLPLGKLEKDDLAKRVVERRIKRRQFIFQNGDICQSYTFILEGCVRMYYTDEKGKEHNIQFASENEWISDIGSLHNQVPSRMSIEAIEPSHILQIAREDLWYLYTNYHVIDHNFRVIVEDNFIEMQNRVLQNISSTAYERYASFLEHYPQLSNRLPNIQIASYLGITPEFLSKIKAENL